MDDPLKRETRVFGEAPILHRDFANTLATAPPFYDHRTAYMLSVVAGWTYAEKATFEKQLQYYGLYRARVEEFRIENDPMLIRASVYLIRSSSGETGILAFRGTEPTSLISWLADFEATWTPFFDHGNVHTGFYANLQALWGDISDWLESVTVGGNGKAEKSSGAVAMKPLKALYVTGHSLGAALAVLAAARVVQDPRHKELLRSVYTYGQPMVGDAAFKAYCESEFAGKLFRHVFDSDIVCRMPPRVVGKFEQFGEEWFCRSAADTWQKDGTSRSRQALLLSPALLAVGLSYYARRVELFRRFRSPYSMDDHEPSNYIGASRRALGPRKVARPTENIRKSSLTAAEVNDLSQSSGG
jgi:hypothetical protein